ncbi:MAG TPA: protein-L-isoaspartate(D-aspartate) O-methyltransferase [Planctomycetaceae bacterium]|nr:protein-L-isoaspartate(D-aspartate) O-methyltransferase [Planctomycetaceae bacterium]
MMPTRLPGTDPGRQRELMVALLRDRGITDERVLAAMNTVPREAFVSGGQQTLAYEDRPLPIGSRQTISQPYTVAFMCQALRVKPTDKVLEVGTGSGYGAAVLGQLARDVVTIERLPDLAEAAAARLQRLNMTNVRVILGDGTLGVPEDAPFDGIIVTAGGNHLPQAYVDQLREGGRIVIPIGDEPHRQRMRRYVKRWGQVEAEDLGDFLFVPLIGADSWDESASGDE